MENYVIQVDYNSTADHLGIVGNHSHVTITCSRLATKWYLTVAIAHRHNARNDLSWRDRTILSSDIVP